MVIGLSRNLLDVFYQEKRWPQNQDTGTMVGRCLWGYRCARAWKHKNVSLDGITSLSEQGWPSVQAEMLFIQTQENQEESSGL